MSLEEGRWKEIKHSKVGSVGANRKREMSQELAEKVWSKDFFF